MMFVFALIMPGIVQAQYGCTSNYQQRCLGNYLYWYDSCGNQQNIAQYCQNGCYNNSCQNSYNNYNNCTYHAFKLCVGNSIYWYNSCSIQQDLYSNCASNGQVCQYGQCVAYTQTYNNYNYTNSGTYVVYYRTACYGNSVHWYDSLGVESGLYKNCADNNSCTADACSSGKCSNIIKCDGSTCALGSADYNKYCLPATDNQNHCGNGSCEPNLGETTANCSNDCKVNITNGLTILFTTKQDSNSDQWQKTAQINSNGQIYFMISVKNNSAAEINNINISANIPSEISSLGNLKIDGVATAGDIVSGINIGSIAPASAKSVTFEGKTQIISATATKQATATSDVSGIKQSDSISINLDSSQAAAAVSSAPATSGFMGFLKHWYLWILVGLVLIFLFVVVFRRLSSNA